MLDRDPSGPAAPLTAVRAFSLLRAGWGIPLGSRAEEADLVPSRPVGVIDLLRALLRALDARGSLAVALWLSLLDDLPALPSDWTEADRRRFAYLAEMARCLRLQRGDGELPWSAEAACGLRAGAWPHRLRLFDSAAPELPASRLGRRWGVAEVLDATEFAGFQRLFLTSRAARTEAS
jgi:hypothetical protein